MTFKTRSVQTLCTALNLVLAGYFLHIRSRPSTIVRRRGARRGVKSLQSTNHRPLFHVLFIFETDITYKYHPTLHATCYTT